jgi:hypothetical protein
MSTAVLDEVVHHRLIQELEHIAAMARIPASMIKTTSVPYLTPERQEWLLNFHTLRANGTASAYMLGKQDKSVDRVMMAMAAVLIRNFVDARVYSLASLIEADADMVSPTVLFVPNFQNSFHGKPLASWQVQKLYSILLDRFVQNKVSVVYVDDFQVLEKDYGTSLREHVEQNYFAI